MHFQRSFPVVLAACLCGALSVLYPPVGSPGMAPITGDAVQYIRMSQGEGAEPPFSFRIGVPRLVSVLPVEVHAGFRILTWLGVWLASVGVVLVGSRLGLSSAGLAVGLAGASFTSGFAHHFHNPYLTDGVGLGVVSLGLLAWQFEMLGLALATIVIGSLVRESTVLLAAFWAIARRWREALLLAGAGLGVVLLVRQLPGMPTGPGVLESLRRVWEVKGPVKLLGDALGTWHVLYVLAALGGLRSAQPVRRTVLVTLVVLVGSGVALSVVAVNTNRMLAFAWPAIVLGLAALYDSLPRIRAALVGLMATSSLGLLVWFPNRLVGAELVTPVARASFGLLMAAWLLAVLWRALSS